MNTLNHDPLNFAFLSLCCGIAFLFYFTMTSQPLLKHFFFVLQKFLNRSKQNLKVRAHNDSTLVKRKKTNRESETNIISNF